MTCRAHHRELGALILVVIAVVAVEGAVVEAVLAIALPHTPWPWISLGIHLYGLGWLLALRASLVVGPHEFGASALYLHDGVFAQVVIPFDAIRGVRRAHHANVGRSGWKIDRGVGLLAHGDATVELALHPGAQVRVDGRAVDVAAVRITADSPAGFVAATRSSAAHPGD